MIGVTTQQKSFKLGPMIILPKQPSQNQTQERFTFRKLLASKVQSAYLESDDPSQVRRGEKMGDCGTYLVFAEKTSAGGEVAQSLVHGNFCRVRGCPMCAERRSAKLRGRLLAHLPAMVAEHQAEYLHVVFTVPNCAPADLRQTIALMNTAWRRMMNRRGWPGLGFIKSVEVTKGKDGSSHPHLHVLLMVPPSYFSSDEYWTQDEWRRQWADALRVSESSIIHPFVRKVSGSTPEDLTKAVLEVSKYAVKVGGGEESETAALDTEQGRQWFLEVDRQISGLRLVAFGGLVREYLQKPVEKDEIEDLSAPQRIVYVECRWNEDRRRYERRELESYQVAYLFYRQGKRLGNNRVPRLAEAREEVLSRVRSAIASCP